MNRAQRRRSRGLIGLNMPREIPDDIGRYKALVLRLANQLLDALPAGYPADQELEQLKEMLNAMPSRFLVVTRVNANRETWSCDVVPRLATRVPLLKQ